MLSSTSDPEYASAMSTSCGQKGNADSSFRVGSRSVGSVEPATEGGAQSVKHLLKSPSQHATQNLPRMLRWEENKETRKESSSPLRSRICSIACLDRRTPLVIPE